MRKGVDCVHLAKLREQLEDSFERRNDPSSFTDCVEFIDKLPNWWLLREGFTAWSYFSSPFLFPFLFFIVFLYVLP